MNKQWSHQLKPISTWGYARKLITHSILLLTLLMGSCNSANTQTAQFTAPAPITTSPPSAQPQLVTATASPTAETESSMFTAGQSYTDTAGDIPISFLDVVGFQAVVNEETEILKVTLHMRDIPSTTDLSQSQDVIEYSWAVFIFLDPATSSPNDIPGDYYFAVNTSVSEPADSTTPTPSGPVTVPIDELFENRGVYDSSGVSKIGLDVKAEPESDTLTLTGHVPGIKSNAVFSFATSYLDNSIDRPDNFVSPPVVETSQPQPVAITYQVEDGATELMPAGAIHAYPGPDHYAGDVLSFEILLDREFNEASDVVTITLDDEPPKEAPSKLLTNDRLLIPLALDTTSLVGPHQLKFSTPNGSLNHLYSFKVLPADQKPLDERSVAWLAKETECCIFHYLAGTAALRDIEFIIESFNVSAAKIENIIHRKIDPRMNVYLIDRIWNNGGFTVEDGIGITYTDRCYNPLCGKVGLETVALHELTHATHISETKPDSGVEFSAEGVAVYVTGGHYKPEPLAQREAALYDLGYYVTVGQFIGQHELDYLHSAAVLTYISEKYGPDAVWKFLAIDDNPDDHEYIPLERGIQLAFGITLDQFNQDFESWVKGIDPGDQLDDLRLTVTLQDLRREYQNTYSPPPEFIATGFSEIQAHAEYLPVLIREADAPANVTIELIISAGQQAILDKEYTKAEGIISALKQIVNTGRFDSPLAKDYLDIVLLLKDASYDTLSLDIEGETASAQVTTGSLVISNLELEKINGNWKTNP